LNIYALGFSPEVLEMYRRLGLNPTEQDRASLQVAYPGAKFEDLADIPLVYHVDSVDYNPQILQRANAVITPTRWADDFISTRYAYESFVVPPGLSMFRWYSGGEHDQYILWEDVDEPYQALFRQVTRNERNRHFITTSSVKGGSNVTMVGGVSAESWAGLVKRAAVYITTLTNAFYPERIAYAMAAGVPVICLNYSCFNELVRHGQNGLIVSPTEDSFRGALAYAFQHRGVLSNNAAGQMAGSDWSQVIPRYIDIYTKVAAGLRPVALSFYLCWYPGININQWSDWLLSTYSLDEFTLCIPHSLEGVKVKGHTLAWIERETTLYGGYVTNGTRIRVRMYKNYPPVWLKENRIPFDCRCKYFAYNHGIELIPNIELKQALSSLETNPGLGTITKGAITIKLTPRR